LNNKHNEFVKLGVYDEANNVVLNHYFEKYKSLKLKFQSVDSLFVKNKTCIMKSALNKNLGRNVFYKGKRGLRISTIVDSMGIPFSFFITHANTHDSKTFDSVFKNIKIDLKSKICNNSNKHKQYFLGDSAYDTTHIRSILKDNYLHPIIDYNNRNTKDITKRRYLTPTEEQLYKKRIKVENFYAILTQYPKMNMIVEKTIESFKGVFLLITCNIICKRINLMR